MMTCNRPRREITAKNGTKRDPYYSPKVCLPLPMTGQTEYLLPHDIRLLRQLLSPLALTLPSVPCRVGMTY